MAPVRNVVSAFVKKRRLLARVSAALDQLASGGESPSSRRMASALEAVRRNEATVDENRWFSKIENLREGLSSSTEKISILTGYNAPDSEYGNQIRSADVTVGQVCTGSSAPQYLAVILFRLLREFEPRTCFELGTCIGVSGSYQAAALKMNGKGQLITFELSSSKVRVAEDAFRELGLDNIVTVPGYFQDTLAAELENRKPIDYVFIDGHHDEQATIDYFDQIYPYLSHGALVVFDDVNWSEGMERAWKLLRQDNRMEIAVDLYRLGVCVTKSRPPG